MLKKSGQLVSLSLFAWDLGKEGHSCGVGMLGGLLEVAWPKLLW